MRLVTSPQRVQHEANVMPFRILHVDDDPSGREIVRRSLADDQTRGYLHRIKLDGMRDSFSQRLRTDAITLGRCKDALRHDPLSSIMLDELQSCAHKLAGAAGVFGFPTVSCAASKLEESVIDQRRSYGTAGEIEANLDTLLVCIERQ